MPEATNPSGAAVLRMQLGSPVYDSATIGLGHQSQLAGQRFPRYLAQSTEPLPPFISLISVLHGPVGFS
jgi:hypothetical protein